mgnify:FL=1|tara:strand:+ start:47 stop:283 length:237 start_codon:yes stop_codon:yes gene_type:complete
MEISGLDFFLINILSYIAGLGTGLLVCCKHKDKFMNSGNREPDPFQVSQPYSPPPNAEVIAASAPPEQANKGVRITLE